MISTSRTDAGVFIAHARAAARLFGCVGVSVMLAACNTPAQPVAPCPAPQAQWLTCPEGTRISAYDPAVNLQSYCPALADPTRLLKPVKPGSPVFVMPDGMRAMNTGMSGWLVFPREKDPTDVPVGIRQWWRDLNCAPVGTG